MKGLILTPFIVILPIMVISQQVITGYSEVKQVDFSNLKIITGISESKPVEFGNLKIISGISGVQNEDTINEIPTIVAESKITNDTIISEKSDEELVIKEEAKPQPKTKPEPTYKFPNLRIIEGVPLFTDDNFNNIIDANETCSIHFFVVNSGTAIGETLKCMVSETSTMKGLDFNKENLLGDLNPGDTMAVNISVQSDYDLTDGTASFKIQVEEANHFGADPIPVVIKTKAMQPPLIKIVNYNTSSKSGKTLQKKEPFSIQVLVQNIGQGTAYDLMLHLLVPENILCFSGNQDTLLGTLASGNSKILEYDLIANNAYNLSTIILEFDLTERFQKYGEKKVISLTLNQNLANEPWIIEGKEAPPKEIKPGFLVADVDENIPNNTEGFSGRIALIIGNEDYSYSINAEPNVVFARNDAEIFKEYCVNTLGVNEKENLFYKTDATSAVMKTEIDKVCEIVKKMIARGYNTELIFYYAGHGAPDEKTKEPYIIPVDVNITHLSGAVKLADLYKELSETGAMRITVILDACFSGGSREGNLLAARSVATLPAKEEISGQMVVFTASSGEQSALPYNEMKHGMFTYYFLKKLQETKGMVSYGEMSSYLTNEIPLKTLRLTNKSQDPQVLISPQVKDLWKNWKFTESPK